MNDYIAEKVMPGGVIKMQKFQAVCSKDARIWVTQNLPGNGWFIKRVKLAVV